MVVTIPAADQAGNGPRPINVNTDIPQLLRLLELVFGETLDKEGRRLLSTNASLSASPAFLWRLNPMTSKLATGYVWEENGRVVGNATLLSTKIPTRFLVVNVAVHPDYRRRGIARKLMHHLHTLARRQQGQELLLQVVKDNAPAVDLYRSLGYRRLGSMTTWASSVPRLRELPLALADNSYLPVRELRSHEWRQAYELDRSCLHPDLNWPEPLGEDAYKSGLWQRVQNFLNGRTAETWVIASPQNELVGLASIWSEWGRAHRANVRVHPAWRGQLERPLLAKLVRRFKYLARRNIQIHHDDRDELLSELLTEANFRPRRTLTHMRLDMH